jgi:hypothetical protein
MIFLSSGQREIEITEFETKNVPVPYFTESDICAFDRFIHAGTREAWECVAPIFRPME